MSFLKNIGQGVFLISFIFLIGCDVQPIDEANKDTKTEELASELIHKIEEGHIRVVTIERCEYVIYKDHLKANQGFGYMAHKGNCSNPIHLYNKDYNIERQAKDSIRIKHLGE